MIRTIQGKQSGIPKKPGKTYYLATWEIVYLATRVYRSTMEVRMHGRHSVVSGYNLFSIFGMRSELGRDEKYTFTALLEQSDRTTSVVK